MLQLHYIWEAEYVYHNQMFFISHNWLKKVYKLDWFLLTCPFSDQQYWTYDDQGNVSFRAVSLPANLSPESKVKVNRPHHTCLGCTLSLHNEINLLFKVLIWELHLVFLQLEHLTCPLMYIVGEDDLSASSIENANLVSNSILQIIIFGKQVMLNAFLLVNRLRRPWVLQLNPSCLPGCRTLVPVTWLNRLTRQIQERPCGASNHKNVSPITELYFTLSHVIFYTCFHTRLNMRLVIVI